MLTSQCIQIVVTRCALLDCSLHLKPTRFTSPCHSFSMIHWKGCATFRNIIYLFTIHKANILPHSVALNSESFYKSMLCSSLLFALFTICVCVFLFVSFIRALVHCVWFNPSVSNNRNAVYFMRPCILAKAQHTIFHHSTDILLRWTLCVCVCVERGKMSVCITAAILLNVWFCERNSEPNEYYSIRSK